jgi:HTH-type transcriptional regulator/antitoxin HigA
MSTALLDERKYRELLDETLPVVIRTEQEHQRLLRATAELMEKPEPTNPEEEGRLLEMLSMLIEEYEDRVHPLPKAEPHKMLSYLLQEKQLKPSDLWDILPKSRVSAAWSKPINSAGPSFARMHKAEPYATKSGTNRAFPHRMVAVNGFGGFNK